MSDWSIYLVRCRNGTLYTGITTDVDRRFEEHQNGSGAKYLRGKGPLTLEFRCTIGTRSEALKLEHLVKQMSKDEKENLLADNALSQESLRALLQQNSVDSD